MKRPSRYPTAMSVYCFPSSISSHANLLKWVLDILVTFMIYSVILSKIAPWLLSLSSIVFPLLIINITNFWKWEIFSAAGKRNRNLEFTEKLGLVRYLVSMEQGMDVTWNFPLKKCYLCTKSLWLSFRNCNITYDCKEKGKREVWQYTVGPEYFNNYVLEETTMKLWSGRLSGC